MIKKTSMKRCCKQCSVNHQCNIIVPGSYSTNTGFEWSEGIHDDEEDLQAAIAPLSTCSQNNYKEIADLISKQLKLLQSALSSFHHMIKHRPNFLEYVLNED